MTLPSRHLSRRRAAVLSLALILVVGVAWIVVQKRSPELILKPEREFEIAHHDELVYDIRYSPDSAYLAAVFRNVTAPGFETRIYRASTGALECSVPNACWSCAWSFDGRSFAAATGTEQKAWDAGNVDIWDTRTWKRKGRMTIRDKPAYDLAICDLCFDEAGNLYAADARGVASELHNPGALQVLVWWDAASGGDKDSEEVAPRKDMDVFSMSAVSVENGTRLAIAHHCPRWSQCPVDIVLLRRTRDATVTATKELTLSFTAPMKVRLAPDGEHLALLGGDGVSIVRLENNQAETMLRTKGYEWDWVDEPRLAAIRMMDISRNGRRLAMRLPGAVTIYDLAEGKQIVKVPEADLAIGLSPNGEYLAVSNHGPGRICQYRLP